MGFSEHTTSNFCPTAKNLFKYVAGCLVSEEKQKISKHVELCQECKHNIGTIQKLLDQSEEIQS